MTLNEQEKSEFTQQNIYISLKRNERPLARGNIKFIQESCLAKEIIAHSLEEINGSDYRKICIVAITSKKNVKNIYKSKDKKCVMPQITKLVLMC